MAGNGRVSGNESTVAMAGPVSTRVKCSRGDRRQNLGISVLVLMMPLIKIYIEDQHTASS